MTPQRRRSDNAKPAGIIIVHLDSYKQVIAYLVVVLLGASALYRVETFVDKNREAIVTNCLMNEQQDDVLVPVFRARLADPDVSPKLKRTLEASIVALGPTGKEARRLCRERVDP